MTQRTQITLETDDHRRARRRAAEMGISLAEYVRRLVHEDLATRRRRADPAALVALGDSGGSDVATAKDRYLGEAAAALRRRP